MLDLDRCIDTRTPSLKAAPPVHASFTIDYTIELPASIIMSLFENGVPNIVAAVMKLRRLVGAADIGVPEISLCAARQIVHKWNDILKQYPEMQNEAASKESFEFAVTRTRDISIGVLKATVERHPHSLKAGIADLQEQLPQLSVDEAMQIAKSWRSAQGFA